ncbi:ABC transporter permease subunit [Vicingus serpentipes]|uniref:ABC transporter permease subunit n=1 Tax=Vicingus serpentipes TaxID=1926625 RepID=A0A5C6RYQ6_9FLAO|nr:ABC transporter permease [Vicingus serpentipes]TXB66780.1 ABC transporter permease subunit [Vicingus serpentipes]
MLRYILKRLIVFIPTLIAISLLAFVISINAPGDPVERLSKSANKEGTASEQSSSTKKVKQEIRKRLGLDLPVFYLSLATMADSDTLYKIDDKAHQDNLLRLSRKYGNWEAVQNYYLALVAAAEVTSNIDVEEVCKLNSTFTIQEINDGDSTYLDTIYASNYSKNEITQVKSNTSFDIISLQESYNEDIILSKLTDLEKRYAENEFLAPTKESFLAVQKAFKNLQENATPWKTYIPKITWYGKNQYHRWLFGDGGERKGVLRGDFGISYIDNQPVSDKIWKKFTVSFVFIFLSILLSYIISIPIGIYSAYKKNSAFDKGSSVILFVLYSMPGFFIGTLLLYAFANPDTLVWFPESGWQDPSIYQEDWGLFKSMAHHWPYMVLPLITYTYSSFAFLSRIMRVGMVDVMGQDFIRTARAKGLGEKKVVLKHALRNSLLPIITVFANIFPVAIGGSVIIEVIFSLPGMGLETFNAILNYDYPMIVAIFTISGFLTVIGYLVADILYAVVDPRISYS